MSAFEQLQAYETILDSKRVSIKNNHSYCINQTLQLSQVDVKDLSRNIRYYENKKGYVKVNKISKTLMMLDNTLEEYPDWFLSQHVKSKIDTDYIITHTNKVITDTEESKDMELIWLYKKIMAKNQLPYSLNKDIEKNYLANDIKDKRLQIYWIECVRDLANQLNATKDTSDKMFTPEEIKNEIIRREKVNEEM